MARAGLFERLEPCDRSRRSTGQRRTHVFQRSDEWQTLDAAEVAQRSAQLTRRR